MEACRPRVACFLLGALLLIQLFVFAGGAIDEEGNYRGDFNIEALAPTLPESTDQQQGSTDLSKQPPEKLFALLAWELSKYDQRPESKFLKFGDFQQVMDLNCRERLLYILKLVMETSEEITQFQANVTSTSSLYWLLHKYTSGGEDSWIWLLTTSHEWLIRKVNIYLSSLAVITLDKTSCVGDAFRVVLTDAAARWKRMFGDFSALLWNGLAFGVYGDVTTWRESDKSADAPVDEAASVPNATWTENLIFGHMWISAVQKWMEYHAQVIQNAVAAELPYAAYSEATQAVEGAGRRMHHQSDAGMFASFEYLRRHTFGQWALDKGLLRALIRHVWKPPYDEATPVSVGDFGAGGGRYSAWLNETGLVHGFAFDGTSRATEISGGKVLEVNLVEKVELWRTFDWVLCLEVAEHVPREYTSPLLQNLKRHAAQGIVMSWSDDMEGIGHVNCLSQQEFVATVERETGYRIDWDATKLIRKSCEIDYIGKTVAVFRAPV
jgi:hypothetical protein